MSIPVVSFDFTSAILDSRITVARALNTATRINSSGLIEIVNANLPRFDFDPVTLACNGLLIEEQRTNLIVKSQQFDDPAWTPFGVTISADVETAPDGTMTADSATSTGTDPYVVQIVYTTELTYTISIYLRGSGSSIGKTPRLFLIKDGFAEVKASTSLPELTGSWQRYVFSATFATAPASFVQARVDMVDNASLSDIVYIWGAQLEAADFVTSYIPTTTTSITRNADVATITGANFSGFWNAGVGGATVTALPSTVSGTRPLVQFDDGTANEIIALQGNTTNPELYIVDGGTPQAQIDAGTIAANTSYTLTGWWQTNFCAARLSNGARVEDLTATIPTVTQMRIGSDGTNYLNGHIATIYYYDRFNSQIYNRRKNKVIFLVL